MSGNLWDDFDGEAFLTNPRSLTNPRIFLLNSRKTKGRKTMRHFQRRRNPVRRYFARRTRKNPRHHHRMHYRRNPSHRKTYRRRNPRLMFNRRRRHYRRNPPLLAGLDLKQLLTGGAALIISPLVEKQLLGLLPTSITGQSYGPILVKTAAGAGLWYVAKATMGRQASDVVAIALGAAIIADIATTYMPSITGMGFFRPDPGIRYYQDARGLRAFTRSGQIVRARVRGLGYEGGGSHGRASNLVRAGGGANEVFEPPF